jgi:hypothetical protein
MTERHKTVESEARREAETGKCSFWQIKIQLRCAFYVESIRYTFNEYSYHSSPAFGLSLGILLAGLLEKAWKRSGFGSARNCFRPRTVTIMTISKLIAGLKRSPKTAGELEHS